MRPYIKGNRLVEVIEVILVENNPYPVEFQLPLAFKTFFDFLGFLDQCAGGATFADNILGAHFRIPVFYKFPEIIWLCPFSFADNQEAYDFFARRHLTFLGGFCLALLTFELLYF